MLGAVGYDGPDVAVAVDPQSVRGVSGRKRVTYDGDTGFSALVPDRINAVRLPPDGVAVNRFDKRLAATGELRDPLQQHATNRDSRNNSMARRCRDP